MIMFPVNIMIMLSQALVPFYAILNWARKTVLSSFFWMPIPEYFFLHQVTFWLIVFVFCLYLPIFGIRHAGGMASVRGNKPVKGVTEVTAGFRIASHRRTLLSSKDSHILEAQNIIIWWGRRVHSYLIGWLTRYQCHLVASITLAYILILSHLSIYRFTLPSSACSFPNISGTP